LLKQHSKCIATVLKGLEKNIVTRPLKQKKNSWQPLLLRDTIDFKVSGERRNLFRTSVVTRYWDKAKAREMVSSSPSIPQDIVTFPIIH
jgi:hypothetical protein